VSLLHVFYIFFFFSSRRRHTRFSRDWSSDVCSSDLYFSGGFNKWSGIIFQIVEAPTEVGARIANIQREMEWFFFGGIAVHFPDRSEERRVGKECRTGGSRYQ